jgi:hypothetical protein
MLSSIFTFSPESFGDSDDEEEEATEDQLPTLDRLISAGRAQVEDELKRWKIVKKIPWLDLYKTAYPDPKKFEEVTKKFPEAVWINQWTTPEEFEVSARAIAEHCDVLLWFKVHHEMFPILTRVAFRYIAKPCSNAFQERVFSSLTFMSKQRQRSSMNDDTFNESNLLRVNTEWIGRQAELDARVARQLANMTMWCFKAKKFFGCC